MAEFVSFVRLIFERPTFIELRDDCSINAVVSFIIGKLHSYCDSNELSIFIITLLITLDFPSL